MTTQEKVESLIEQAAELPEGAQAELMRALAEMRSQQLGIYPLDDEEQEEPAFSAVDRLGHFGFDEEITQMYARYDG
jgi:hypothetical protein